MSGSLVVADDRILPRLPDLRAGVFHKEGFDVKRNGIAGSEVFSEDRSAATNGYGED
jgi:hypothetical protein